MPNLIRRWSVHVRAGMPSSAAHEVFVDDLLFAVADVHLDEGIPVRLVRLPGARWVRPVFVDRALGPCAGFAQSVLDFAQGTEPVDGGGRGSAGGEGDSLVVAKRGERLGECVVLVPAGWGGPGFEAEPVDQVLDPVA